LQDPDSIRLTGAQLDEACRAKTYFVWGAPLGDSGTSSVQRAPRGCCVRDILFVAGIALGLIITAAWAAFLAFEFIKLLAGFF
jgi:hypothetical protein